MKTIYNIKNGTKTTAEDDEPIVSGNDEVYASVPAIENINKKEDLIASAKAKLMAGEPMTEEEANLTLHI